MFRSIADFLDFIRPRLEGGDRDLVNWAKPQIDQAILSGLSRRDLSRAVLDAFPGSQPAEDLTMSLTLAGDTPWQKMDRGKSSSVWGSCWPTITPFITTRQNGSAFRWLSAQARDVDVTEKVKLSGTANGSSSQPSLASS